RENFDEPAVRIQSAELKAGVNVSVQRSAVELRKNVNLPQPAVDAVADRDVDQPILSRQWHGGLRAILGEREKACAGATAHDHSERLADCKVHGQGGHGVIIPERASGGKREVRRRSLSGAELLAISAQRPSLCSVEANMKLHRFLAAGMAGLFSVASL